MVRCHQRLFSRRIPSAWSSGIAPRGRGNFWRVFRRTFTTIDDKTRIELEAAVFRRVVSHLRSRTDVQNIEMMDLTGFCRNCSASWMLSEAEAVGLTVTRDEGLRAAQTPRNRSKCFVHSSRSRPSHDEDGTRPCPCSRSINRHAWASPINPRVKGKAASMLAEKQLPTPQKQSRIQKHPSRRPPLGCETDASGRRAKISKLPARGHWRYVPRPCIVAVTRIDRWADFEGGNDEFETN
jgi:Protein of unknown function (DUF1244)